MGQRQNERNHASSHAVGPEMALHRMRIGVFLSYAYKHRRMQEMKERATSTQRPAQNWRAAPLVFFSPPSSKLGRREWEGRVNEGEDVLLATLQCHLHLVLADGAFQTQDNLFRRLCLLVEHRLGLSTITGLLAVVTTLSLCEERVLALLVLCDLVGTGRDPSVTSSNSNEAGRLTCVCGTPCPCSLFNQQLQPRCSTTSK